jgi:hypothetical protein
VRPRLPCLCRDLALAHRTASEICTGTGRTPATFAPGLGSPRPHLHQDWACPCHICAGTRLAAYLHWDWAHLCHICTGTASIHKDARGEGCNFKCLIPDNTMSDTACAHPHTSANMRAQAPRSHGSPYTQTLACAHTRTDSRCSPQQSSLALPFTPSTRRACSGSTCSVGVLRSACSVGVLRSS